MAQLAIYRDLDVVTDAAVTDLALCIYMARQRAQGGLERSAKAVSSCHTHVLPASILPSTADSMTVAGVSSSKIPQPKNNVMWLPNDSQPSPRGNVITVIVVVCRSNYSKTCLHGIWPRFFIRGEITTSYSLIF